MIQNEIRVMLAKRGTSAAALSTKIPDMNKVCMSFIVNGAALPTREGMQAMCRELDCKATDLYDEEELNLNVTAEPKAQRPLTEEPAQATNAEKKKIVIGAESETVTIPLNSLEAPVRQRVEKRKDGHENQERVFFWFDPEEKAALIKATEALGYRNLTEWMREMYRLTLKQYAALKLEGKTLHDLVPPLFEPESPATK
jgi:DNA-binding Xre family transcriptional regulator